MELDKKLGRRVSLAVLFNLMKQEWRNGNLVHLQDVKVGRDLGKRRDVVGGVKGADEVIVNSSDSPSEGAKVVAQLQPRDPHTTF
jgi:hypothetical protein